MHIQVPNWICVKFAVEGHPDFNFKGATVVPGLTTFVYANLLAQGRVEAGDGVVVPQTYLLGMNVALGGSKN